MTVYVDAAIHSWRGKRWAHLFSEDLDELHAFAARLGLKRCWFQQPPRAQWPHYDVTSAKRIAALGLGAVPASRWKTLQVAKGRRYVRELRGRYRKPWQLDYQIWHRCRGTPREAIVRARFARRLARHIHWNSPDYFHPDGSRNKTPLGSAVK